MKPKPVLHLLILITLLLSLPSVGQGQTFSPDGTLLLFSIKDAQNASHLAFTPTTGTALTVVSQSQDATAGVWSPDGKQILFVNSDRSLFLYTLETQATHAVTINIEAPLVWREDGKAFAAIVATQDKEEITTRELCRFDRDGHIMGRVPLDNLKVDARYPFYWITQTDEVALFARNLEGTNCYITDADQLRRVSSTHDLVGLGAVDGGRAFLWARKGENLHYILMTLYRYVQRVNTVERLTFPERLSLLNPNPRTAPESLQYVSFSKDGTRILVSAIVKQKDRAALCLYSLKNDGSSMRLLHVFVTPPAKALPFPAQFSPDGKQVAWWDDVTLYLCNVDGTHKTKIAVSNPPQKEGE